LQGLRGKSSEAKPIAIFDKIFEKYISNLGSWVHTLKVLTIFHIGMEDATIVKLIADVLKQREETLYSFAKKQDDNSYDAVKHHELGKLYFQLFKLLINIARDTSILRLKDKDLPEHVRSCSTKSLFSLYEQLELSLITINKLFIDSLFCSKFRIYKCLFQLLYRDADRFNKVEIMVLTELVKRINTTDIDSEKKICLCYANYIEVTKDLREKILIMLPAMKFTMLNIKFFDGDLSSVQNLKKLVEVKIEDQQRKSEIPVEDDKSSGSDYKEEEDDMFKGANYEEEEKHAEIRKDGIFDFGNPSKPADTKFDDLFESKSKYKGKNDDNIGSYD
jgi:hypothetical protein